MSASLVGSEMCIRDRAALHDPRRGSVEGHAASADRQIKSTNARGRFEPVSYTHLTLPTICSV
eukprot:596027-Alexandrium_andersonii.AAC.1